jgi:hypothetical protein
VKASPHLLSCEPDRACTPLPWRGAHTFSSSGKRRRGEACLLIILLFSFITITSTAQVDSVKIKSDLHRIDSLRDQKLSIIDSAELKLNNASSKIKKFTNGLTAYDTLGQKPQVLQAAIDKHKARLTSKIDSLKTAGLPSDKYSNKLDSLNKINPLAAQYQKVESKVQEGEAKVAEGQSKLNEGQNKIQQLGNEPTGKVNEKLNLLSKESNGQGNLPPDVKLPDTKLPDTNLNVQKPGKPNVDKPSVDLNTSGLKKDINLDPKLDMPKVKTPGELEKITEAQGKVGENLDKVTEKAAGYGEDAKNISKGNIDDVKTLKEDALAKASMDEEMKALKGGDQVISEQKALMQSFKNPDEYKKQVLSRGKEMALKQLAAREQLQLAMNKVSKYQKTAGTILNKKADLPKRRDPLKQLKFYQKFVPGITLQVQKPGAWLLDVNPTLRYRLTSYWSVGSGWNDRLIIGNYSRTREQTRVFGLRTFSEVIIFKGLSMRLDVERMNAFITPKLQQQDIGQRQWNWMYLAGLKKEFTFMKGVVGNVQFMYNLYDPHHYRIYPTRFNTRFGFEFPMKGRKKN